MSTWRLKLPRPDWTEPSVIVTTEKNDSRYLDATSLEAFHRSALSLLRERFEGGYYYDDPSEWTENAPKVDLDAEFAATLPPDSPVREAYDRQVSARDRWEAAYLKYRRWYGAATAACRAGDGDLAWRCLKSRSDAEYEGVRLERLEGFSQEETDETAEDEASAEQ